MCHVVRYVFQYFLVRVTTLKAQTLPLSLNVLMLYGDMEQMAKLSVFIVALLAWIDSSREFIIKKNTKNASNFFEYFKNSFKNMYFKIN